MRAILLAAAAAIWAGQAGAAPWTFTFRSHGASWLKSWITVDYTPGTTLNAAWLDSMPGCIDPIYQCGSPFILDVGGYAYGSATLFWPSVNISPNGGDVNLEWDDGLMTGAGAVGGAWSGSIYDGMTFAGGYTEYFGFWDDEGNIVDLPGRNRSGIWAVTAGLYDPDAPMPGVPLPATAPMLLGAVALVGLLRGRASRGARSTSDCKGQMSA